MDKYVLVLKLLFLFMVGELGGIGGQVGWGEGTSWWDRWINLAG